MPAGETPHTPGAASPLPAWPFALERNERDLELMMGVPTEALPGAAGQAAPPPPQDALDADLTRSYVMVTPPQVPPPQLPPLPDDLEVFVDAMAYTDDAAGAGEGGRASTGSSSDLFLLAPDTEELQPPAPEQPPPSAETAAETAAEAAAAAASADGDDLFAGLGLIRTLTFPDDPDTEGSPTRQAAAGFGGGAASSAGATSDPLLLDTRCKEGQENLAQHVRDYFRGKTPGVDVERFVQGAVVKCEKELSMQLLQKYKDAYPEHRRINHEQGTPRKPFVAHFPGRVDVYYDETADVVMPDGARQPVRFRVGMATIAKSFISDRPIADLFYCKDIAVTGTASRAPKMQASRKRSAAEPLDDSHQGRADTSDLIPIIVKLLQENADLRGKNADLQRQLAVSPPDARDSPQRKQAGHRDLCAMSAFDGIPIDHRSAPAAAAAAEAAVRKHVFPPTGDALALLSGYAQSADLLCTGPGCVLVSLDAAKLTALPAEVQINLLAAAAQIRSQHLLDADIEAAGLTVEPLQVESSDDINPLDLLVMSVSELSGVVERLKASNDELRAQLAVSSAQNQDENSMTTSEPLPPSTIAEDGDRLSSTQKSSPASNVEYISMYSCDREGKTVRQNPLLFTDTVMQALVDKPLTLSAEAGLADGPATPMSVYNTFLQAARHFQDPLQAIQSHLDLLLESSAAGGESTPAPAPTRRLRVRSGKGRAAIGGAGAAGAARVPVRRSVLDVEVELLWKAEPRLQNALMQSLVRAHRAVPVLVAPPSDFVLPGAVPPGSVPVLDFREHLSGLDTRLCTPSASSPATSTSAVEHGLLARPDLPTLTMMRVGSRCDKTKMANLLCAGQSNGPFVSCDNEDPALVQCRAKDNILVELSFVTSEMLDGATTASEAGDPAAGAATPRRPPPPVKVINAHGDISRYPEQLVHQMIEDTTILLVAVRLEEVKTQPKVAVQLQQVLKHATTHGRRTELWVQVSGEEMAGGEEDLETQLERAQALPSSEDEGLGDTSEAEGLEQGPEELLSIAPFSRTTPSSTLREDLVAFCAESSELHSSKAHKEHSRDLLSLPVGHESTLSGPMRKLLDSLRASYPDRYKNENLPLHGKDYFGRFAELARKQLTVRYSEEPSCDISPERIEADMLALRTESLQMAHVLWGNDASAVRAFFELASAGKALAWQDERLFTQALAAYSKDHVQGLDKTFNDLSIELHHAAAHRPDSATTSNDVLAQHDQHVAELSRERHKTMLELDRAMLGLEHFWRELGQHYRAWHVKSQLGLLPAAVEQDKEMERTALSIPSQPAQQLLEGFAVELMDGDASFVATDWIKPILLNVSHKLRVRHGREVMVAVVSVFGLQSSGKSTLLNALFGVSFPTAANRCSRGISMQLVRVGTTSSSQAYDYVLVLDTEGLESNLLEHDAEDRTRDQRMVALALAVSNLAIFNVEGIMVSSNMAEMLKVAIAALLQTKEINLTELEMFVVHQKVEPSQREELRSIRSKFTTRLDEFTRTVSKEAHNVFSDLVAFDSERNVAYLPPLFHERAGVQVTNASYGREVQKLLTQLLTCRAMLKGRSTLDAWARKLSVAWTVVSSARRFGFGVRNMMQLLARENMDLFTSQLMEPDYEIPNNPLVSPGSWVVKERELLDRMTKSFTKEAVRGIKEEWAAFMDEVGRHREAAIDLFFQRENNPELEGFRLHAALGPSARIAAFLKGIREHGLEHIDTREEVCGLETELQEVQKALTQEALKFADGGEKAGARVSEGFINAMIEKKIKNTTLNKRNVSKDVEREFNRDLDALMLRIKGGGSGGRHHRGGAQQQRSSDYMPWESRSSFVPLDLRLVDVEEEVVVVVEGRHGVDAQGGKSKARDGRASAAQTELMAQCEQMVKALKKRMINFFHWYSTSAVEEMARQLPELRKRIDAIISENRKHGADVNVSSVCVTIINNTKGWCEDVTRNLRGYTYSEEFVRLVLVSVKIYVEPQLVQWHDEWWRTNSVRGILAPGSERRQQLVSDLLQIAQNIDCNKLAAEHLWSVLLPKLEGVYKARVLGELRQALERGGHMWAKQKASLLAAMQYRALVGLERDELDFLRLRVKHPHEAMLAVLEELTHAALGSGEGVGVKGEVRMQEVWEGVWQVTVKRFLEIAKQLAEEEEEGGGVGGGSKTKATLQTLLDRFKERDSKLFEELELKVTNGALPIPSPATFERLLNNTLGKMKGGSGRDWRVLSKERAPVIAGEWAQKELVRAISGELLSCSRVCPYCSAVCMLSTADHDHHSAFFHQPSGLGGVHSVESKRLCTSNCCEMVAKDMRMRTYKDVPEGQEYVEYRMSKYAEFHPSWQIPDQQDGQASGWEPKIVMARLNAKIAEWYGVEPAWGGGEGGESRGGGEDDPTHRIPDSWVELCEEASVRGTKERLQRQIGFDQWCGGGM